MLRLLSLFILFLTTVSIASAQKLKKRTESYGTYKEVYHIDKETKFRCGESFIINNTTKDTLAIGHYLNSARADKWIFGDIESGEDYMIYNYSNDSLIYLNQSLVADSFLVKTDNGYELKKVDRPLLYVGYKDEIIHSIGRDLEIPLEVMKEEKVGLSLLQYFVDEKGNLSGPKLVSGFSKEMEQSINRKVVMLPGKFLPAIFDGNAIASTFFVRVNVGLDRELFAGDIGQPYILHIDSYYNVQVTEQKERRRIGIRRVDISEVR
ncbi:hypothetical protein [uncultured Draconibacterium sp.]|uniref:hypothetical protein n=1 Tax=uncultured Draconibacterium sp. TaxID=1573823 RepID=UPI002AA6175E|nr:hypothetical protein [uncultured Draconibacterium sp.]